jgi:hypothetical protein
LTNLSRQEVLVDDNASCDTGAWTADGKQIVYFGVAGGGGKAVYLVKPDDTGKHKVADVPDTGDLHETTSRARIGSLLGSRHGGKLERLNHLDAPGRG